MGAPDYHLSCGGFRRHGHRLARVEICDAEQTKMNLTLVRHAYLPTCTLGELVAGDLVLATIERPWLPNPEGRGGRPMVSCVPDGYYRLIPHESKKFGDCWALINEALGVYYQQRPAGQTWGRTAILIHV